MLPGFFLASKILHEKNKEKEADYDDIVRKAI